MSPAALQRQAALAGAALLAVLLVVILDRSTGETQATAPPPVAQAQWETATVGIFGGSRLGDTTAWPEIFAFVREMTPMPVGEGAEDEVDEITDILTKPFGEVDLTGLR